MTHCIQVKIIDLSLVYGYEGFVRSFGKLQNFTPEDVDSAI